MQPLRYAIALTGGIATGKSSVAAILQQKGFVVVDADTIAHQALEDNAARVIEAFGDCICSDMPGAQISRKKLGAIVFADPEKLRILESIVHPSIAQIIYTQSLALEAKAKPFFVDIPIFFEKPELFAFISKSVLVYAPPDVQFVRLQKRNNLSPTEAKQRIDAQIPIDAKVQRVTHVIDNSGDLEALKLAIERYLQILKADYGL